MEVGDLPPVIQQESPPNSHAETLLMFRKVPRVRVSVKAEGEGHVDGKPQLANVIQNQSARSAIDAEEYSSDGVQTWIGTKLGIHRLAG